MTDAPRRKPSTAMFGEAGYARVEGDAYFTIDAGAWVVPALLSSITLRGPVFEPSAGAGHLVDALRTAGYSVAGSDLFDYGREDVRSGVDLFSLTSDDLAGFGSVVCNLPYSTLDAATAHILDIARPHGLQVASLVRAEWPCAKARRPLVHANPAFDSLVVLTKRPRWNEENKASPRFNFVWCVWDFSRDQYAPPSVRFAP